MLLLNVVRVIITLLGLLLIETFRRAWNLEGFPLIAIVGIVLVVVFTLGDMSEEWLTDFFNKDGSTPA